MNRDRVDRRAVVAAAWWGVPGVAAAAWVATEAGWIDWPAAGVWLAQHAMSLGWAALTVLLTVWAAWRAAPRRVLALLRRWTRLRADCDASAGPPGQPRPRPAPAVVHPPLSRWMVAAAMVVVAAVALGATTGLWHVASAAKDPAAAQVDAIKTGLSIAAGTGGMFALLVAVRRQWHQELTAASTETDAASRRITEHYTNAADQLGSDKAPVRLAGLHALERLAQDNPDQRPTIVQVLCSYLRMPYTPPDTTPDPNTNPDQRKEHRDLVQERQVRLTAQRILGAHLHPGPDPDNLAVTFWPDTSLDLTDAFLIDFSLINCRLHTAQFKGARFAGNARFGGAQFTGHAWFDGAQFTGNARFSQARFAGEARFDGAEFAAHTRFDGAQFTGYGEYTGFAGFSEARFAGDAVFEGARFAGDAVFDGTHFARSAHFGEVQVAQYARFHRAQFAENAVFNRAKFAEEAMFAGAVFAGRHWSNGHAVFDEAEFIHGVVFDRNITDDREWCWVRVGSSLVWPPGWAVQPLDGHRPPDHNEGKWGHLVYTPDPSTGAGEPDHETGGDTAMRGSPASPDSADRSP